MKIIAIAAGALCASVSLALAADLPSRQDPVFAPEPAANWSGFYVGVQAGAAVARDKLTQPATSGPAYAATLKPNPAFAGLHAGFATKSDGFVYGIEADADFGRGADSSRTVFSSASTYRSASIGTQASLRGRIGYDFDPVIVYATAGLAMADVTTKASSGTSATAKSSGLEWGWTIGAGAEWRFEKDWSVRSEYRYTDFGSFSRSTEAAAAFSSASAKHKLSSHAFRIGVSYYFD